MNRFTKTVSALFLTAALWSGLSYANALTTYAAVGAEKTSISDVSAVKAQSAAALAITKQPTDYTGALGSQAAFKVAADGVGLQYQWQLSDDEGKNWRNSSVKTAAYATKLSTTNNNRLVRCIVTDAGGKSVTSSAARMKIAAALAITKQPTDYTGALGSQAAFKVAADGVGLQYQWQLSDDEGKNWRNSSVRTAAYATKLSTVNNNRLVRCIVTDAGGKSVTSSAARMKIAAALKITKQPTDYTGALGSQAAFKVAAEGAGLQYQWQLSDDEGKNWRNSSVRTAAYATKLSTVNNNRLVRCIVTDANGKSVTSSAARMKITAALKITKQPTDYTGALGSQAAFKVAAEGAGLQYQWQLSDDEGKNWRNSSVKTAAYETKLSTANHNRLVRCIVTDAGGKSVTSSAARMKITAALKITKQPTDYTGALGSQAAFKVETEGVGLQYQWQLSDDEGKSWRNSSTKTAAYATKLSTVNNNRLVRCIVTDFSGKSVTSNAAKMQIEYVLKITEQPKDDSGELEELAEFTVEAEGEGLRYQWQVSADGGKTWANVTALEGVDDGKDDYYAVEINVNTRNHQYRCVVTDSQGKTVISNAAKLLLIPYPLKITVQPEDYVAEEEEWVSFGVEAEGYSLRYQWQVSTDSGKTWTNVPRGEDGDDGLDEWYSVLVYPQYNNHQYRCVITDFEGTRLISNAAKLTLVPNPLTITEQPEDYVGELDDEVTFTVEAEGYGLRYQWQVSTNSGKTWTNISDASDSEVGKMAEYSLCFDKNSYKNRYRCVVTDFEGSQRISNVVKLTLIPNPLTITEQPEDYYADEDEWASFYVGAEGYGLRYQWQVSTNSGRTWKNVTKSGEEDDDGTNEWYDVLVGSSDNKNRYRCIVTDFQGNKKTSQSAVLYIGTN